MRDRSICLDMARGFAALAVAAGHLRAFMFEGAGPNSGPAWKAFIVASGQAHNAVIVFFVLSGYLIGKHVAARFRHGRWSWSGYAIDRLTRLWIVLVPALMLTATLDWIGRYILGGSLYFGLLDPASNVSVPNGQDISDNGSLSTFIGNLLFLQNGIVVNVYGVNGPLWSLANEFWYYVVFPLAYCALRTGETSGRRGLCAGLGVVLCLMLPGHVMLYGLIWLLGVGVAAFEPCRDRLIGGRTGTTLSASAGAAFLLSLYTVPRFISTDQVVTDTATATLFSLLIWLLHDAEIKHGSITAAARFLSSISYTLYLTHFPFMALVLCFICDNRKFSPSPYAVWVYVGLLVLSLLYASLLYLLFERHTHALATQIRRTVRRVRRADEGRVAGAVD